MNLTTPTALLTNLRQRKLAPAAEPKLVLEWQDGPATDLGFRQQKLRLSFARMHKPTRSAPASEVHSMALEHATSY